jgi:hypothetical protein
MKTGRSVPKSVRYTLSTPNLDVQLMKILKECFDRVVLLLIVHQHELGLHGSGDAW